MLELPTDRPRPRVTSYLGVKRQFRLGPALAKGVRDLSRREQTSLFTVFAATLNVLLYRYSGQDDILVGIPIADRDWPELQPLIGFFVDTHVLRTDLTGNPTFHELLGRVKRAVVGVYSHRALPFAQVVETLKPERNLSYSPLFQVMLNWRDRGSQLQFVGLTRLILEPLLAQSMTSKFDLTIFLTDAVDDIWLEIEYSTELFDDVRIERIVGHLRTLLEGVLADADRPISELPLLTDPERQQILFDWNQTEVAYPKDQCLHELIEEQGERTPDAVAVVFEDTQLTYWQLNERANQLALLLRRLGVGPNTLVGICLERSLEMVVGLLGVLKAGAAYVPLDPTYPRERLAFMLRDSGAAILLTQAQLADSVPGHQARIIRLDADWPAIAAYPSMSVESEVTSRDPAYVVYTSGSTGNPKGVQIPHRALVNFLCAMRGNPGVTAMDTLLAITTLSFDIAGLELWLPLIVGARVVIADRGTTLDGQALAELLDHCGATILQATPNTWRLLLAGGWRGNPRLKILCGGEPWPTELARQLLEKCDSLWNMYGPTETTIWSAACRINPEEDVLIGAPIANTQLYVLDPHLQPVPVGVPGELCIGGDGLASGYLRHPELTADKFRPNPFCDEPRGRIYKTGDLVRFRADGKIEFLGRLDHQVKIRGFRIELGEIETVLSRHPDVKTAAVLASEANTGDQRLIAYVVPNHDNEALDNPEADADRISVWQAIWDNTYNSRRPPEDPSFNIAGWRSSYDGQPIPDEEMREWVDDSVRRILALQPKHVLDLGCGTGLLLFRLAPHCDRYCGLDFSATVLGSIRQELGSQKQCHAEVTLLQRRADDLADLETESFDAVILNSVVQYFPNIDYLVRVLERASCAVKPGGFIFLGDVRNLHLWKAFCSSVQLYQAPAELPLAELRQRIRKQMSQEEELLIAPEFFLEVKQHLPSISDVEIQLKRGHYHNEVTLFRYDVILHFGSSPRANGGLESWDWQQKKLTLPALQDHLEQNQPSLLHVRAIPNERLQRELKVLEWLDCNDQPATVSELREAVEAASLEPGVEPENLWKLGELLSYSVEITWSDPTRLGSCDAIFRRRDNGQIADSPTLRAGRGTGSAKPWISYANRPLQGSRAWNLIPSLRDYLKGTMPEYMLPSDYILLDAMPLTPNGKLDRKALPAPDSGRPDLEVAYVPPRTPVEVVMARLWAEVLGVERVGIHDNFFELGGHSLLATQIISRLRRVFDLELPLRSLFEAPTVAFLAGCVERMRWAVESQEATSSPDSGSGGETALVEELI